MRLLAIGSESEIDTTRLLVVVITLITAVWHISYSHCANALDIIKISQGQSEKDARTNYTYEVLETALILTEPEFGPFRIDVVGRGKPNLRTLKLLQAGEAINVALAITRPQWEDTTIPIRIPVRMGLLNYRLLAVRKDKLVKFKNLHTIEQLKQMRVGLRVSWATWETMRKQDYNVINSHTYDSTFAMLQEGRFDYIPRGIHEIYEELEIRKEELPDLTIEPNLALYIPAPYYVFVSKHEPGIAERMKVGLNLMVERGIFKEMISRHYGEYIEKSDLKNRRILYVGNELLPPSTPLDNAELWLDLSQSD